MNLEKPKDCCICSNSLHQTKKPLSCGHWVHFKCMKKWGNTCPLCRTILPEIKIRRKYETEEYEEEFEFTEEEIIAIVILHLLSKIPLIFWIQVYLHFVCVEPMFISALSAEIHRLIPEMLKLIISEF